MRVLAAQAKAEFRALQAQMAKTNAMAAATSASMGRMGGGGMANNMTRWGSQVQWAGRQLQYNFTIPLAIAGLAATKFQLDNEKAMTRIKKVYGDGSMAMGQLNSETEALGGAMEALSNKFAVNQAETLNIAADWAAAGASGLALAKSVALTMETMVLGEMDAVTATESLIAIQAQYGFSTKELADTINTLNIVENQTGTKMSDLIEVMTRTAGTARTAGIDVRYLAAMAAALVPAAGSAAAAGNGLRTIISRVMAPTRQAGEVMNAMGLDIESMSWKSSNAVTRLEMLSKAFFELDDSQKAQATSLIASRWQINKADVLFGSIASATGYYAKALEAAKDPTANLAQKTKELKAVLESNPQKLKQVWIILQNAMARVVAPLIPMIVFLARQLGGLFTKFSEMSQGTQRFILIGLAALAAVGMVTRYVGVTVLLFGELAKVFGAFSGRMAKAGAALAVVGSKLKLVSLFLLTMPFKAASVAAGFFFGKMFLGLAGLMKWVPIIGRTIGGVALLMNVLFTTVVMNMGASLTAVRLGMVAMATSVIASVSAMVTRLAALPGVLGVIGRAIAAVPAMIATAMPIIAANLAMLPAIFAQTFALVQAVVVLAGVRFRAVMAGMVASVSWMLPMLTGQAFVVPAIFARMVAAVQAVLVLGMGRISAIMALFPLIVARATSAAYIAFSLGMQAMAVISAFSLGRMNFGIQRFFLQVLPATIAAGMAVAQAFMMRGFVAMQVVLMGGVPAIMSVMAGMMSSIVGLFWTTFGRLPAIVVTAGTAIGTAAAATGRLMMAGFAAGAAGIKIILLGLHAFILTNWRVMLIAMFAPIRAIPGILAAVGAFVLRFGPRLIGLLFGPWGIAITAIVTLLLTFKDQIFQLFRNIGETFRSQASTISKAFAPVGRFFEALVDQINNAFWALPVGIQNAMIAVVRVVKSAVSAVARLFTSLNPFANHDPSKSVKGANAPTGGSGVAQKLADGGIVSGPGTSTSDSIPAELSDGEFILNAKATKKYGTPMLNAMNAQKFANGGPVGSANANVKKFNDLKSSAGLDNNFSEQRADVASVLPQGLALFDSLVKNLEQLNAVLKTQGAAVDAQQGVVDRWSIALKNANLALDIQQAKLDGTRNTLDALNTSYDAHKDALADFAAAPIKGMGAMSDAIFENDMAQKKLRLEMLSMDDAGHIIDDIAGRMSSLQGDIETLRGTATELRNAGAGSDVLGPVNDQIKAMEAQYKALSGSVNSSPTDALQARLDQLAKDGEKLDLENSIKFDPLTRQIDKLANGVKEVEFADIIAGINGQRSAMAVLQPQIDVATAAMAQQQAVVDRLTLARDAVNITYDVESAKLSVLKDNYDITAAAIRDVEEALNSLNAAAAASASAESARKAAKEAKGAKGKKDGPLSGEEQFLNAAGGNWDDVGGFAQIGREGGAGDQSAEIDAFAQTTADEIAGIMGDMDPFKPIKEKWESFKTWWGAYVAPAWTGLLDGFAAIGDTLGKIDLSGFADKWGEITVKAKELWDFFGGLFGPQFTEIWEKIQSAVGRAVETIKAEFSKWEPMLKPGLEALQNFWTMIQVGFKLLVGVITAVLSTVFSILGNIIGPIIDMIAGVIGSIIQIVRGVLTVLTGIFTLNFGMIWDGVMTILGGLVSGIWTILKGLWGTVSGLIQGLVEGVVDWFTWLWDVLVGHSIIPDMINAIVQWFKNAWTWVVDLVKGLVTGVIAWFASLPGKAMTALATLGAKIADVATKAWALFRAVSAFAWVTFTTWLKSLPQKAWDGIILIREKLADASRRAWASFSYAASTGWAAFIGWIKGLPQKAWSGIIAIKDKLAEAARAAFQAMRDKAVAMVEGKGGLMSWIGSLPGKISKVMGGVGKSVADAVKGAWNGAAKWINDNGIKNINKVTKKLGFTLGNLPTFARGGIVPGGQSKTDNMLIGARSGEGVLVPEAVRAIGGAQGLEKLNRNSEAGISKFARGGVVGGGGEIGDGLGDFWNKITGGIDDWISKGIGFAMDKVISPLAGLFADAIPGNNFMEQFLVGALKGLATQGKVFGNAEDKKAANGDGSGPGGGLLPDARGMGYQRQMAVLRAAFPGITMNSGYRPGATVAGSGRPSMHGLGRAVDIPPQMKYFDWINKHYGKNTKELIFSPAGGRQLLNGNPYLYGQPQKRMHYNHVHWGYDEGGWMQPGVNQTVNKTGKPEPVFNPAQWQIMKGLVLNSTQMLKISTANNVKSSSLDMRPNVQNNTININGNLEFPNIKSGDDAEVFIENLKTLAGGARR